MHKSKIFIAGASVLAAGGAIYAATQKQPMEKAAVTEASPGVVKEIATRTPWQPVVDGKDSPTCKPEKGAQWVYSIKASDRAKISPEGIGLPAGGEPIEVSNDTDTRLVLDVLEGGGEQALLLARFVRMNSSLCSAMASSSAPSCLTSTRVVNSSGSLITRAPRRPMRGFSRRCCTSSCGRSLREQRGSRSTQLMGWEPTERRSA